VNPRQEYFIFNGIKNPLPLQQADKLCELLGGRLPGEQDGKEIANLNQLLHENEKLWLNITERAECGWWYPECCGKYLVKTSGRYQVKAQDCNKPAAVICEVTNASLAGFTDEIKQMISTLDGEFHSNGEKLMNISVYSLGPLKERITSANISFDNDIREINQKTQEERIKLKEITTMASETFANDLVEFKEWITNLTVNVNGVWTQVNKSVNENENRLKGLETENQESQHKLSEMMDQIKNRFDAINIKLENTENSIKGKEAEAGELISKLETKINETAKINETVESDAVYIKIFKELVDQDKLSKKMNASLNEVKEIMAPLEANYSNIEKEITSVEENVREFPDEIEKFIANLFVKINSTDENFKVLLHNITEERKRQNEAMNEEDQGKSKMLLKEKLEEVMENKKDYQNQLHSFKVTFFPILGLLVALMIVESFFLFRKKADGNLIEDDDL